jgi:hypothetical protein
MLQQLEVQEAAEWLLALKLIDFNSGSVRSDLA